MAKKVLVGAEDAPTALSGGTCVRLAAGRIGGARELLARSYPEMSILRFLPPAFDDDARTGNGRCGCEYVQTRFSEAVRPMD